MLVNIKYPLACLVSIPWQPKKPRTRPRTNTLNFKESIIKIFNILLNSKNNKDDLKFTQSNSKAERKWKAKRFSE